MQKPAAHALTWCPDASTYTVRDPEHDRTLAAIFGDALTLTPESQEWFAWLAGIPSFAFEGRAGRFTARRETKQRGERYWIAYQRVGGKLRKRYLGRTSDLTAEKLETTARSMHARPASPDCTEAPVAAPPTPTIAPHAWELIPEQVMDICYSVLLAQLAALVPGYAV
jgi:LuxR family maltose regulon positive regulatory protein